MQIIKRFRCFRDFDSGRWCIAYRRDRIGVLTPDVRPILNLVAKAPGSQPDL